MRTFGRYTRLITEDERVGRTEVGGIVVNYFEEVVGVGVEVAGYLEELDDIEAAVAALVL